MKLLVGPVEKAVGFPFARLLIREKGRVNGGGVRLGAQLPQTVAQGGADMCIAC